MELEPHEERRQQGFPSDQPLEALKADHRFVRKMFGAYLNTNDPEVRRQAGPRILELLEMHTALEETIFYPRVRSVDAQLVDQCEDEHQHAKQLISQLKGADPTDPQCENTYRMLSEEIIRHIDEEEHQLFPKVQQSQIDMQALGLEMQAFEANMVASQAQQSERPGAR
ncbi:hemerythrin domain-containing protein [Oxalobacteraceae bacterium OM1]|nr:hemerythrin domain-containing protein [Oxalobacteraceae bacterium OM1]